MTKDEAQAALQNLAAMGFMEELPDGSFKPTPLGRLVAENSGGVN